MIKSMTGYGDFDNQNEYAHIYVEIKSLNSRFFEFYPRTCKILSVYDNEIKNKIKHDCTRGNFQLKTKIKFQCIEKIAINKDKIKNYIDIQSQILEIAPNIGKISMDKLISMIDIYEEENIDNSLIKDLYLSELTNPAIFVIPPAGVTVIFVGVVPGINVPGLDCICSNKAS